MPQRRVTSHPASQTGVERWLRRIFVDDWSLKLLALAIALVLWFLKSGRS
jgi:hypothetical protein